MISSLEPVQINISELALMIAAFGFAVIIIFKTSRSIFDPWFPVGFNHAILLVIVSYLYIGELISLSQFIYWITATAALFGPLILEDRRRLSNKLDLSLKITQKSGFFLLVGTFLCLYQVFFDLVFIYARGIPVFAEYGSNPQIYMGGFGVVKYIHDAVKIALPPIATYILFCSNRRRLYGFMMLCSFYPAVLFEWSKVGFITVAANYWISYFYFFGRTDRMVKFTRLGFILSAVFVLFMFSRVAASGYGGDTLGAILLRLVDTADSVHMYYLLGASENIPGDYYFLRYVFSLVVGFFSISVDSVGHILLTAANMSTSDGFGPSPPAQIIGNMFFYNFGIFYCLIVGLILRAVRRKASSQIIELRLIFLMLYIVSSSLTGDASLLFYYLFILFFIAPPIICATIISKAMRRPSGRSVCA